MPSGRVYLPACSPWPMYSLWPRTYCHIAPQQSAGLCTGMPKCAIGGILLCSRCAFFRRAERAGKTYDVDLGVKGGSLRKLTRLAKRAGENSRSWHCREGGILKELTQRAKRAGGELRCRPCGQGKILKVSKIPEGLSLSLQRRGGGPGPQNP